MTTHGVHGTYSRPVSQYVAPVVRTPAAPPEAMAALLALLAGLGQGEGTPCAGDARWTSDSPRDVAAAIDGCSACPVFGACEQYAHSLLPSAGVWAAQQWTGSAGLPGHVTRQSERRAS